MTNNDIRKLILQAEIAALLHDIGKFSTKFLEGGNYTESHTVDFFDAGKGLCDPRLLELLSMELPSGCLVTPDDNRPLKTLGDLARWHHETHDKNLNAYFTQSGAARPLPALLYLMMCSDTLDSASSKGGASFTVRKGEKRNARYYNSENKQELDFIYLATPFGMEEAPSHDSGQPVLKKIRDKSHAFHRELIPIIEEFLAHWHDLDRLGRVRNDLRACLEKHLSGTLAETRLPNNDDSLWQHSNSTAAIFKAMLAGHLLRGDHKYCDDSGNLAQHREELALLGVCWSEDQLTARSFRPAEILGRRKKLDDCVETIRERMETGFCLGNEVYRNRDGMYFLIPDKEGAVAETLRRFIDGLDPLLNAPAALGGELQWEARYLPVGLQITRLADILGKNPKDVEILASGPIGPAWIEEWEGAQGKEVCPRCGLRPVDLQGVIAGSEGDDRDTVCESCRKFSEIGGRYRNEFRNRPHESGSQARRLLGISSDQATDCLEFDVAKFFPRNADPERPKRLALIQGITDLRPFFSGEAFSSILAARPENFSKSGGKDDQSREMGTWETMLAACGASWNEIRQGGNDPAAIHTLQQIFHDTYLFNDRDGRAPGVNGLEKGRNFLQDTVLQAPFPELLKEDNQKLVSYALRQHPAPSRLARVWETALGFNRFPMRWCEEQGVTYAVIAIDPGRFMILVAADQAWDLLQAQYGEYTERFGRVRRLLPFHLSATVFYHKSPLYIAIDAARRFAELGLRASRRPEYAEILGVERSENLCTLHLRDFSGGEEVWNLPTRLPNGKEDSYYGWFWVKGIEGHPVPIEGLEKGNLIALYPSTFDYEILDATTRRYDIRNFEETGRGRPHSFLRGAGPRPYPLERLADWGRLDEPLRKAEMSQRKTLVELLASLHQRWGREAYGEDLRDLAQDALINTLGKTLWRGHGKELLAMACDGSLFDLFEWQDFISK